MVQQKFKKPKIINLNFVCTGNTCRSYIAEAVATHLLKTVYFKQKPGLKDKINIGSAGTDILFSEIPVNTYRVLDMLEIPNIKFKPTQIDLKTVMSSDLIITMATSHKKNIAGKFAVYDERKIINLLELANIILYIQSEKIYSRNAIERNKFTLKNINMLKHSHFLKAGPNNKSISDEKYFKNYPVDEKLKNKVTLKAILDKIDDIKNIKSESIIRTIDEDISDPFGKSIDAYMHVAKLVKENIIIIFNYLFG
jgi:protein-tyrosine-phosphatase